MLVSMLQLQSIKCHHTTHKNTLNKNVNNFNALVPSNSNIIQYQKNVNYTARHNNTFSVR